MSVEKSAEIPESGRFLRASSSRLTQTDTKRHKKTADMSVKDRQVWNVLQQNVRANLLTGNT